MYQQYPPPSGQTLGQYPPQPQQPYPPANIYSASPQYQPAPPQYAAAAPQYQQPVMYQPAPQPIVVLVQPGAPVMYGSIPQAITCPSCHQGTSTYCRRSLSAMGWVWVVILIFIFAGTFIPLCFLPFIIPSCYDVRHYCQNCGTFLGEYRATYGYGYRRRRGFF